MRLTPDQCSLIIATMDRHIGVSHRVSLYGSRLNDQARGGDVDLLIESDSAVPIMQSARIKNELEGRLQLPVDLLVIQTDSKKTPFQTIALAQAVPLEPS